MKTIVNIVLVVFILLLSQSSFAGTTPNANFSISPSDVVVPGTTVCFTDQSDGGGFLGGPDLTNWDWTFDGQAPAYSVTDAAFADTCIVMNNLGTWNICLTVTNDEPETDNICHTVTVADPYNIGTESGNTLTGICKYWLQDDGGYGNYGNNQDNTVTLCTGTSDFMAAAFDMIDLGSGDVIEIYEGTTASGTPIATYTSTNNGTTPLVYASSSCITVHFTSDGSSVGQGFLMQAQCHTNIIMNGAFDGETFTGCSGNFYDSGGPGSGYGNNESNTVTLCANSATDVIQLEFTGGVNLGSGDQLNAYDGTGTGGQVIYTTTNWDNQGWSPLFSTGLTITGLNQCMTLEFISNGSSTGNGWGATINCATPPVPCNSNPIAADNFDAATMICDFSQYCGETSSFYGIDMHDIAQSAVFDGSIENNSWLMFVADSTNATFNISVTDPSCGAIQIGIYSVDANENFTWLSPPSINGGFDYTDVSNGFSGVNQPLNAQGMTPGETYYIMIDGHGGDVCPFELTAGIGVQLPEADATGPVTMCYGDTETVSVVDLNGSTNVDWEWTWTGGGQQLGSSVDLSGFSPGTYTFDVTAYEYTECVTAPVDDQVTVIIDPCSALPVELANFDLTCFDLYTEITWETVSEQNNDYFVVEKASDNLVFEELQKVNGAGYSNELKLYSVQDFSRNTTSAFYRIRQVDYNGTATYSETKSIETCSDEDFTVYQIYFDATSDELVIDYSTNRSTEINLNIVDLTGSSVIKKSLVVEPNLTQFRIDASPLNRETLYLVNLTSNTSFDTGKVLISK